MTFTPRLEIYPQRITENARAIFALCHSHGIEVASVTKVACAHPAVVQALLDAGTDMLADSRIENLAALRHMDTGKKLLSLRIPTVSRAMETVQNSDLSLVSSMDGIRALAEAAKALHKVHSVILMVDLGDLREGVWPDQLIESARTISRSLPSLKLAGIGANLACYGGVIPSVVNMGLLTELHHHCEQATDRAIPILCGGNSANLPIIAAGDMPPQVNLLRVGETTLLGANVIDRSPWPGTRQDTFRLIAEVVELERKPSLPIGETGQDAFGGTPTFVDRGSRQRAICNIGRQDTDIGNLHPEDPGIIILGGSSDHLVLDVEDASPQVKVGDEVAFTLGYSALLGASTSAYVAKVVAGSARHNTSQTV